MSPGPGRLRAAPLAVVGVVVALAVGIAAWTGDSKDGRPTGTGGTTTSSAAPAEGTIRLGVPEEPASPVRLSGDDEENSAVRKPSGLG